MGDNGNIGISDDAKLILKVELKDKQINVEFGKDINTLFIDRGIRLASLHLDNLLIASKHEPNISLVKMPLSIFNKLRRR